MAEARTKENVAKQGRSRRTRADSPGSTHLLILGLRTRDAGDLMRSIDRGLPFLALDRFQREIDLPWGRLADIVQIKPRTLTRRKSEGRLAPDESERLLRVARIYQLAVELFDGDAAAARRWLSAPKKALAGAVPLDYVRSEVGAREVEHLIGRLEHGVFS